MPGGGSKKGPPSNAKMSVTEQMYVHHENLKKREYNKRVMTVNGVSFSPRVQQNWRHGQRG